MDTIVASVMHPTGGVLRFHDGLGPAVVAEPQGDGWWWVEGRGADAGAALVADGEGCLFDLDQRVVAEVGPTEMRVGPHTWTVEPSQRTVGPAADRVVAVSTGADGVMRVSHGAHVTPAAAVLVALTLPAPSGYIVPTPSPGSTVTRQDVAALGSADVLVAVFEAIVRR